MEELIKIASRANTRGLLSTTASVLFSNLQPGTYKVSVFDVKQDGHVNISMPYYYDLDVTVAGKQVISLPQCMNELLNYRVMHSTT